MSRDQDWAVFEKACDITASAVRGTMGTADGKPASFVVEVFREVHEALHQTVESLTPKSAKAGF